MTIRWLDISEQKKGRILSAVKTEMNDYGCLYFLEKYRKTSSTIDESGLELVEESARFAQEPVYPTKFCVNLDSPSRKDTAPITQKVLHWLMANGLEYITSEPDVGESEEDLVEFFREYSTLKAIITCYSRKDYLKARKDAPVEKEYDTTIYDRFGCFIGLDGNEIDAIYDEKFDLDKEACRADFLRCYLDICHDSASINPAVGASQRMLQSMEAQSEPAESGGRFGNLFDGAKKGITGMRDEIEQKIAGNRDGDRLRKTGGSVFGMLSAAPTSLAVGGLDAVKSLAKGAESVSTGVIGAGQAKTFDLKCKKTIQQSILAAKLVEYLETLLDQ